MTVYLSQEFVVRSPDEQPRDHCTLLVVLPTRVHLVQLHRKAVTQNLVLASHVEVELSGSVAHAVDLQLSRIRVHVYLQAHTTY